MVATGITDEPSTARGEVYECRRSSLGGYAWQPLFPAYPAGGALTRPL